MQNKKHSRFLFIFSFLLLLYSLIFHLSSCKKSTEPPFNVSILQLQVLDVSCTEAWLSLRTEEAEKDSAELKLNLFRDDSLIASKPFNAADSIIYTDGLQPATTYSFSAKLLKNGKLQATSNQVTATTMDTTSHDFEWQTFEFGGQGGSSSFYDVAIIDENDIWAVGEIYTADDKYNAAHWDGEKWELKKVPYVDEKGYVWITPIYSIFAFSNNDIWFEGGIHWDGSKFISIKKNISFPSHVNKIWGTSSSDLYIVGNNGLIAHYDGRQWQRIESGTDEKINDIWGIVKNNQKDIYCVSGKVLSHTVPGVIKIEKNKASPVEWPYQDRIPHSVWFVNSQMIFVAGGEVALKDYTQSWRIISHLPRYYIHRIRGNANNDLFIAGAYSILAHFNGYSWYLFESGNSSRHYESLDFKDNLVVVVGHIGGRIAFIKMGTRK